MAKKLQTIRFEQNIDGVPAEDRSILFVRIKDEIEDKHARFEVPYTHNAYVVKGGGDIRFYSGGTKPYDVFDNREELKEWKKGATVDIIYIPKDAELSVFWGTPDKFIYRDFSSNKVVKIGARGQFRISISNPEQFIRKVVGPARSFVKETFQDEFRLDVINEFRNSFLQVVQNEKLTYDQFGANLKRIGDEVGKLLNKFFEKSKGITLVDFVIGDIDIDDEDMAAVEDAAAEAQKQKQIKEYLAELERLDDKQWEREKYLRQLEIEDRAAYYAVLKVIGHPGGGGTGGTGTPSVAAVFCPHCGASVKGGDIFCSKCGTRVVKEKIICSKCGKQNDSEASFCASCGNKLK